MFSGVARPTYDDVNLILKLFELRREERLREARGHLARRHARHGRARQPDPLQGQRHRCGADHPDLEQVSS